MFPNKCHTHDPVLFDNGLHPNWCWHLQFLFSASSVNEAILVYRPEWKKACYCFFYPTHPGMRGWYLLWGTVAVHSTSLPSGDGDGCTPVSYKSRQLRLVATWTYNSPVFILSFWFGVNQTLLWVWQLTIDVDRLLRSGQRSKTMWGILFLQTPPISHLAMPMLQYSAMIGL